MKHIATPVPHPGPGEKPDSTPFPHDASYHGERVWVDTKLRRQVELLEQRCRWMAAFSVVMAIALLVSVAVHYPRALAVILFIALLSALVAGGILFALNRGDRDIGVS